MPPSKLRKEAREVLKNKWKKAVFITLAFFALSMLVGFIQSFIAEESIVYSIIDFAFLVINIPLSFGLLVAFMKFKRNQEVKPFDFFKEGISRFGKSWGIWFHTFIRLLLPAICLVLVVILIISLGIASFLAKLNWVIIILGVVILIATVIYVACRALLYVIAYNISFDNPELSSKECVKKSAKLMKGNRGNYILLQLSFIGWILLLGFGFYLGTSILITLFGYWGLLLGYALVIVGMSYLMPYMQIATICFYEKVVNSKKVEE